MTEYNALKQPFSNMELASFCGQLALTLRAGISSMEGIELLLEQSASKEERQVLHALLTDLQTSGRLDHALEVTHLFPSYLIHMVRLGEETGTLDEVMEQLRIHYEREARIAASIKSAVTYPLLMVCMMLFVILVLIVKVLPIFQQVFLQLGTEMSGVSLLLVNAGNGIRHASVFLVLIACLLGALFLYTTHTRSGRVWRQKCASCIPPIRKIYEGISACRFASGMALTLRSALPPEQGLELVREIIDTPSFLTKLDRCMEQCADGTDFFHALSSASIFSGMYARMLLIGAKTGTCDQVMEQIASLYQEELDAKLSDLLSVIEPTLVISLSLIVGGILLSVMLPLLGIMSGI